MFTNDHTYVSGGDSNAISESVDAVAAGSSEFSFDPPSKRRKGDDSVSYPVFLFVDMSGKLGEENLFNAVSPLFFTNF